ncbi:MAG: NAD(+)/NADH kinase [Actinomycetota bacterium]
MTVRRVAIVAHPDKPGVAQLHEELTDELARHGIDVASGDPDLVVSLGGDGTMLRAAHMAHSSDALLLGVNRGRLGYLTEVEGGSERGALERILRDDYVVEERMMLACKVADERDQEGLVGLNEVLVEREARYRVIRLRVRVGGESLGAFNADGVIVATPTGSTAYALSAGGPIVSPRASCIVLVPVSPHMLFSRPFVLAPDEVVEIVLESPDEASLSLDGGSAGDLHEGDCITVRRHPRPLKLVRLSGPGFVERLRAKLQLPG